jgi:hypothetical protein
LSLSSFWMTCSGISLPITFKKSKL